MAGLLLLATVGPAPASPADPYQIFAAAREYFARQHYPARVEYTVAVSVVEGGAIRVERYRSGYDAYDGTVAFDAVSDVERAHPYTPHGINIGIPFVPMGKPAPVVDYLGVPVLAPAYGFGLGPTPLTTPPPPKTDAEIVREVRQAFHDPNPRERDTPAPSPSPGLREIATVESKNRTYDIALDGIDSIDGSPAYHLSMRPLHDPGRYRLRQLWVDEQTFAPRKLVESINFVDGPGTTVPWSVTFVERDGALYIDRETALAPMTYERHHYASATIAFEDIHPVTGFPPELSRFIPEATPLLQEP